MTLRARRFTAVLLAGITLAACSGRDAAETTDAPEATSATTESDETTATEPSTVDTATDETTADTTEPPTDAEEPGLSPVTPAATTEVDSVTWAVYREIRTLDPIYTLDYPENTVITSMCESVLQQQPDGTVEPGLATLSRPDDNTLLFTVRDGVTFWDGSQLTAEDVAFSLQRQADFSLGGFYGLAFLNVTSIEATSPTEVTITLAKPDIALEGELASIAGIVVSKAFVEAAGAAFGTADGGTMCTGPYKFDSWSVGERVSVVRNDAYWNGAPLVGAIDFVGVPDDATLTAGLLSGDIDGSYIQPVATFDQLASSSDLTISRGPSFASMALIVSKLDGPLGDVAVRQALSGAIDRQGIIDAVFHGTARMPKALANPGTWGYANDVFEAAYDALPDLPYDVEAGRAAVEAAGATGGKIVLVTTAEIGSVDTATNAIRAAAEEIGLEVELQSISAANYINLFIDPSARAGIDGFVTANYPDYADPFGLLSSMALPTGFQNYSGYQNDTVTELLTAAQSTLDPTARAELVTQAQTIIAEELPWIPLVHPDVVLVTRSGLTGAPSSFVYMSAPWAATLGGL